jgi:hypothetical protein
MQAKIQKGKRTGMEKYKKKKYTDAGVKACWTTRRKRYSQTRYRQAEVKASTRRKGRQKQDDRQIA